ncbi:MAG: hypothetical protein U0136_14265 [Bdellovibrionota bacterium]
MADESRAECPAEIVEALEDMNIEIALLQQLVLALAESAETISRPAYNVAAKNAH